MVALATAIGRGGGRLIGLEPETWSPLLHDTVEDTETTLEEIEAAFGERVAGLVAEVTDDKSLSKQTRKDLQVEHAAHASRGAQIIKLADKTSNLRALAALGRELPPPAALSRICGRLAATVALGGPQLAGHAARASTAQG